MYTGLRMSTSSFLKVLKCSMSNGNKMKTNFRHQLNVSINFRRKIHTKNVREIQIPTDWGHIAGKWWGDEGTQPILALHGWQDNAGTWDALIPYLPPEYSILAIDFAGHGFSSWLPKGMDYTHSTDLRTLHYVIDYFKWDKVSFLSHSMGSIISMLYSSLYPDKVNFYIGFENLVYEMSNHEKSLKRNANYLKKLLIEQKRLNTEPPSYLHEDALKIWHHGTNKSVLIESAALLGKRGLKVSQNDPMKYYFTRDGRLKYKIFFPTQLDFFLTAVQRITCPVMYIKAIDSGFGEDAFSIETRELLQKSNSRYESHFLTGTHHIHLNNPELVAPLVTQFLQKYGNTKIKEDYLDKTDCVASKI